MDNTHDDHGPALMGGDGGKAGPVGGEVLRWMAGLAWQDGAEWRGVRVFGSNSIFPTLTILCIVKAVYMEKE